METFHSGGGGGGGKCADRLKALVIEETHSENVVSKLY